VNGTTTFALDGGPATWQRAGTSVTATDLSEQQLVRRAQRGDVEAFGSLFELYQARIFALCLRMTSDRERAADLTQDAFVRAWEKLGSFRGDSRFLTWLHRLAVNLVIGEYRSRGRWESSQLGVETYWGRSESAVETDPAQGLDLERSVAGLPPQARAVYLLHDVEGYRHREIADMMGVAEGTSKAHLHRARRLLREALNR
jgi:RNA polymerase sigma-70 factor, ECF subfamily